VYPEKSVKKFKTFPLADQAEISDEGDTTIPTAEDVWYAKEFVDENEK